MKKSVFCCILLFFYSFFYLFAEDYKYSLLIREGTWRALNYKITIYSDEPIYMDSSKKVWVKDSYYCTINGKEHGWFEDYFFDSDMTFEHIIWYIEADYWIGNGDSTKIYIPLGYDDSAPSVTYSPSQTFFSSTETEISVAIKDNGVGLKSVNGKNASGEYSETKNFTGEGKYIWSMQATDILDNTITKTKEIFLDITPPVCASLNQETNWCNYEKFYVLSNWTDNLSGVLKCYYSYDKKDWLEGTAATITKEGKNLIYFKAVDRAGNESEIVSTELKIDRTNPTKPIIQKDTQELWTNKSSVTVKASSTDSLSGISKYYYSYDKNNWKEGSSITITEEGSKVIYFKAVDRAGNESEISSTEVKIDRTRPVKPTIQNDTQGLWTNKDVVKVIARTTDNLSGVSKYYYSYDNKTWVEGSVATITAEGKTTVYFKATDNVGNESEISSTEVKIDRTRPVKPTIQNDTQGLWTNKDVVKVIARTTDNLSGVSKYYYSYDNKTWVEGSVATIMAEGRTIVYFKATDNVGNESNISTTEIKIDRTNPIIDNILYVSNEKELKQGDLIKQTRDENTNEYKPLVKLVVSAKDFFNNTIKNENKITYFWKVYKDNPQKVDYKSVETNEFIIDCFGQDKNFISIYAKDEAGNVSKEYICYFYNDNFYPEPPRFNITTASHKRAEKVEDATRYNDASFDIYEANISKYGMEGFYYSLYKGRIENGKFQANIEDNEISESKFISSKGNANISLNDLLDNEQNEFYGLEIKTLGTNGIISSPNLYVFRIDTRPPENYEIFLKPQIDSELWYKETQSELHWMEKSKDGSLEKTGVKIYEYRQIFENEIEEKAFTIIENPEKGYLDIELENNCQIQMRFTDFAGNSECSNIIIAKIDDTAPIYNGDKINAFLDGETNKINLELGEFNDEKSGIDRLEIEIKPLLNNGNISEIYKYLFTPEDNKTYVTEDSFSEEYSYNITISCYDKVGNRYEETVLLKGRNFDEIKNSPITIKFDKEEHNFRFTGTVLYNIENNTYSNLEGKMYLPLQVLVEDEWKNEVEITKSEFENLSIKTVLSTASEENPFRIEVGEHDFTCTTIGYSQEEGLIFDGIKYLQQVSEKETENFEYISNNDFSCSGFAGFSPVMAFSTKNFSSKNKEINIAEGSTDFIIKGVNALKFDKGIKRFFGNMSIDFDKENIDIISEIDGKKQKEIFVENVMSDSAQGLFLADLKPNNVILTLNNIPYELISAKIKNNTLIINEAYTILKFGDNTYNLMLLDFNIDCSNWIVDDTNLKLILKDSNNNQIDTITDGCVTVDVETLKFDEKGSLIAEDVTYAWNNVLIDELKILQNGFDYENANFQQGESCLNFYLFGFNVNVLDFRLSNEYVYIDKAVINFYENKVNIDNLVLNAMDSSVIEICEVEGSFEADIKGLFGKDNLYKNIRITPEGILSEIIISWNEDNENFYFKNVKLDPDYCTAKETNVIEYFTYGTYKIIPSEIYFNGESLKVLSGKVELTDKFLGEGIDSNSIVFENLEFNFSGNKNKAVLNCSNLNYSFDGWNFYFEDEKYVYLSEKGIEGSGFLYSEKGEDIFVCYFSDFILSRDKIVNAICSEYKTIEQETSEETTPNIFLKNDYLFYLDDCKFLLKDNKYILECPNVITNVYTKTDVSLNFSNILVDGNLSILKEVSQEQNVELFSSNKYLVKTTNASLNDERITLKGQLCTEELVSKSLFNDNEIYLAPDFSITAESSDAEIEYQYAGWNIKGKGVKYEYHKIIIEENKIEFNGKTIPLGKLSFNDDFELIDSSELEQDIDVKLLSDKSKILYTRFSSEGLNVRGEIYLPAPFDNCSIIFEKIYLESNGNFYVKTAVKEKNFSLLGMDFSFQDISLGSEGINIESFSLNIKEQQDISITINGLSINTQGQFLITGMAVSPFIFLGMTYCVQDFSIKENGIFFKGYTILPSTLPGVLSSMKIAVKDFFISFDGSIYEVDIKTEGKYSIPLEDWTLTFENIGVEAKNGSFELVLGSCGLIFPYDFNVQAVEVEDVRYDLIQKRFVFEEIKAKTDFSMELSGIKLTLKEVEVSGDWTFGFRGDATFDENFPEFLRNCTTSAYISFGPTDGIKDLSIEAKGLSGKISEDNKILILKDGEILVEKQTKNSVTVSIKGGLYFTEQAPVGMQDVKLEIEEFSYDGGTNEILNLSAKASGFKFAIGQVQFDNIFAEVKIGKEETNEKFVNLGGSMILPQAMSDVIAASSEQRIDIETFKLYFDGRMDFDAIYTMQGPVEAFDSIILSNIYAEAIYESNSFTFVTRAHMDLSEDKFPEGIGGISTDVDFVFSENGIESAYAYCNLKSGSQIFNTFTVNNAYLEMKKSDASGEIIFAIGGSLRLPGEEKMPQGIANAVISIDAFKINSRGELLEFEAGIVLSDVIVYNAVKLKDSNLRVEKGKDDFIIKIGGNVQLIAQSLPTELKNATIRISDFIISTKTGVKVFNVSLENKICFTVMEGLKISIDSLGITNIGFNCAASAEMTFTGPMQGVSFDLTRLEMGWDFKIKDIQGGIGSFKVIDIAGFSGSINKLYFVKDGSDKYGYYITLEECRITLPNNLGSMAGKSIGIKNANFKNGKFEGTFEIPEIDVDIVGFNLNFKNPQINFADKKLDFDSVSLTMPEAIKLATIGLKEVEISAKNGLQFNGGEFRLPDFSISDGVGFKGLYVNFVLNGNSYEIEGEGGLCLANCGEMYAAVSFTNISEQYPIGLKRAYFSFEATSGGIPLANTGLQFSGIRGGLAYGEPNEIPITMRHLFEDDGIRIQLGLTLTDIQTTGKVLQMKPDTWVDVKNLAFAFSGQIFVLKGTFDLSAQADAGLSRQGFYTGLAFELKVVKGNIEFYIFDENGVKFAGRGSCQFGLQKGALFNKQFKILWKKVSVCIPPSNIWLPKIGAEFGDFNNKGRGFKAYASVAGFGDFGIFVGGKNKIKFGSVSSYTLVTPKNVISNETVNKKASRNMNLNYVNPNVLMSTNVFNTTMDQNNEEKNRFKFTVKTKYSPGIIVRHTTDNTTSKMNRSIMANVIPTSDISTEESSESGLDRIIFVCCYAEGDPEFYAISPTGKEYRAGSKNVETTYFENCITFIVNAPEAGDWGFAVNGLDEDTYAVDMLVVEAEPTVTIETPILNKEKCSENLKVKGKTSRENSNVHIFVSTEKDEALIKIGTVVSDEKGYYEANLPTDSLFDDEYYIAVKGENSLGEESKPFFATGTYLIDRSEKELLPPLDLLVSERESYESSKVGKDLLSLFAVWKNSNGKRTAGYKVKLETITGTDEINVGNVTEFRFSNYEIGTKLSFSVCSYDENNIESKYSDPVLVEIGKTQGECNKPTVTDKNIYITGSNGETLTGNIELNIENYYETGSIQDYIRGKIESINNIDEKGSEYFTVLFDDFIKISDEKVNLPWKIFIAEECPTGTFDIGVKILNEGNKNLYSAVNMVLEVVNPDLIVETVEPKTFDGSIENEVTIYGNGFIKGTRYYFDGQEVTVKQTDNSFIGQKTLIIPTNKRRGTKELRVVSPMGKTYSYDIDVYVPDWNGFTLIDSTVLNSGENTEYPIFIEALDGYTGDVELSVLELPKGMEVDIPELTLNEVNNIVISTDSSMMVGEYEVKLVGNNEQQISLYIQVQEDNSIVEPRITQINPYSVFVGDEVTVYGYGFGTEGILNLNGKEIEIDSWTSTAIRFTVTKSMETGVIYIDTKTGRSNSTKLFIHERGFSIHSSKTEVKLNKDIPEKLQIAVNGYAKKVKLSLNQDPSAQFVAELSKTTISPNGIVMLELKALPDAKNGSWELTIQGTSEGYYSSETIVVSIGDRMEIDTASIYSGQIGVSYKAWLKAKNQIGKVEYSIVKGSMPAGLQLSPKGEIKGVPSSVGEKNLTIKAEDEIGQTCFVSLQVKVVDNSWAIVEKDQGHTRSTIADMPSTKQQEWHINTGMEGLNILISENIVFAHNGEILKAFSEKGRFRWQLKQDIKNVQIGEKAIYLLTKDNTLYSLDKKYGNVYWKREDVSNFTISNKYLVIEENKQIYLINTEDDTLISLKDTSYDIDFENIIWVGNQMYEWGNQQIRCVFEEGKVYTATDSIRSVSADSENFVVVTNKEIVLLDSELQPQLSVTQAIDSVITVLTGLDKKSVFVQRDKQLVEFDRKTLDVIWMIDDVINFAIGNEKAIVCTSDAIKVLNRYTGKEIWKEEKQMSSIALYGEKIYSSTVDGEIICYNGNYNATAPKTEILLSPNSPDGTNGWYKTIPNMKINSEDAETYVESIMVNYDGNGWGLYNDKEILHDGYTEISAYGIDNKNFRGNIDTKSVKIDTVAPTCEYKVTNNADVSTWISHDVELSLFAKDEMAGVNTIILNDSEYVTPINFSKEGIFPISWYAIDNAGNIEQKHEFDLMIDKFNPTTSIKTKSDKGICVVFLSAYDSGSGVDRIEFSLNGDTRQIYKNPIVILNEGEHVLSWEVFDISGKSSGVQNQKIFVSENPKEGSILALPELNGKSQNSVYPIEYGSMLFKYDYKDWSEVDIDFWQKAYFDTLPNFVINGDYIQWNGTDMHTLGRRVISWYVKKDSIIYVFTSPTMQLSEDWKLIESNVHIQNSTYPEGFKLYMKRAGKGDFLEIEITDEKDVLPLVVIKEEPKISSEIYISRKPCWNDYYYGDTKKYREGVQIELSVQVSPNEPEKDIPMERMWTYEINGKEKKLDSLTFNIPKVIEPTELTFIFKIKSIDGKIETVSKKTIIVEAP